MVSTRLFLFLQGLKLPAAIYVVYQMVGHWSNQDFLWGKAPDMIAFLDTHAWLMPTAFTIWIAAYVIGLHDAIVEWIKQAMPKSKLEQRLDTLDADRTKELQVINLTFTELRNGIDAKIQGLGVDHIRRTLSEQVNQLASLQEIVNGVIRLDGERDKLRDTIAENQRGTDERVKNLEADVARVAPVVSNHAALRDRVTGLTNSALDHESRIKALENPTVRPPRIANS